MTTKLPPFLYGAVTTLKKSHRKVCYISSLYNVELNSSRILSYLYFTISTWNKSKYYKWCTGVRNVASYELLCNNFLTFMWLTENSIHSIYDSLWIKLIRLKPGFRHIPQQKVTHNFADTVNPLFPCRFEMENT